jgi:hypothetical protein
MARGHRFLLLGAWVWHIILYKLCYSNPILIGESTSVQIEALVGLPSDFIFPMVSSSKRCRTLLTDFHVSGIPETWKYNDAQE